MTKKLATASFLCLTLGSSSAIAVGGDFEINGFLSFVAARSDASFLPSGVEPVYDTYIRKRFSYEHDSNVGLQFTKMLKEDIGITTQFLATAMEYWHVEAIWAFLKWEPNDHWTFRVGRMRTDPYMLSDYIDVGYAYPWVRPPEEVYSQVPDQFTNLNGIDAKYKMILFKRDLSFTGFYGASTAILSFPVAPNETVYDIIDSRIMDLFNLSLKYGDEVFSIHAGYESARITLDPNEGTAAQDLNAFLNGLVSAGILTPDYVNYFSGNYVRASFRGIGYQFDWKNIVSMGEIVKRKFATPVVPSVVGWYMMGGYRFNQFLPHITFARSRVVGTQVRRFNSTINEFFMAPPPFGAGSPVTLDEVASQIVASSPYVQGGVADQSSVTFGLRWDVYDGVAIKGEYKHIHPDSGTPGLFNVNPQKSVNIFSLAVDAVM